jgi:hypothetical protein
MDAAQVKFNEIDESFFVNSPISGLGAVSVRTKRGPWGHDGSIMNSWPEFVKKYGGEDINLPGTTQIKRAFARGARLRINKMGHYTTIGTPSTLDAVLGTINESGSDFAVMGSSVDLWEQALKYKGLDYNNLTVQITDASNGVATDFNLLFTHALEPDLNETYENIRIPGKPTAAASNYLAEVVGKSKFFNVTYNDISITALTAPIRPINGTWGVSGGTDGTAPNDTDYGGDAAGKTGWYAFDDFDEGI